jgi:hypothetical protein
MLLDLQMLEVKYVKSLYLNDLCIEHPLARNV